jgi:hypothetical protein
MIILLATDNVIPGLYTAIFSSSMLPEIILDWLSWKFRLQMEVCWRSLSMTLFKLQQQQMEVLLVWGGSDNSYCWACNTFGIS